MRTDPYCSCASFSADGQGICCREAANYNLAIDNFQAALGLNPYNKAAADALDTLDRQLKGVIDGPVAVWPTNAAVANTDTVMEEVL